MDGSKRAYVAGTTTSPDFPLKNPFQAALRGGIDAFVTRLSADGKSLSYSTYLGGDAAEAAGGIAVDDSNRAYVTGFVASTDFPTTSGAFQTSNAGGEQDAFVTKLWATGAGLIYSTYLGGTAADEALDVAVDSSGRAYVTGRTTSLDFPVTASSFQRQRRSGPDAFVTRLSASGSGLSYSTYLGGNGGEEGRAITVNSLDQAHVTGQTNSPDFPTKNRVQSFNRGANSLQNDAFVTKLWANGAGLHYSTYLGGRLSDGGNGIRLDNSGNAYVTGTTGSEDFPTTSGAFQRTFKGFLDAFVTKIAP